MGYLYLERRLLYWDGTLSGAYPHEWTSKVEFSCMPPSMHAQSVSNCNAVFRTLTKFSSLAALEIAIFQCSDWQKFPSTWHLCVSVVEKMDIWLINEVRCYLYLYNTAASSCQKRAHGRRGPWLVNSLRSGDVYMSRSGNLVIFGFRYSLLCFSLLTFFCLFIVVMWLFLSVGN